MKNLPGKSNPLFILLFAALLFLSSCASQQPARQPPNVLTQEQAGPAMPEAMPSGTLQNLRPVKVGILLPLSGEHQQLGQSMLKAAQMALFDIGSDSFELIPRDTGATPAQAQQAARSAITDGAELLLGPVFSESVAAVKPIAQQSNVNVIAFSTDWKQAGGNAYIMGFVPFDQVDRVIKYAASRNITRIGVLAPSSDYGQVTVTAYQAIAGRTGLQTPALERFNPQNGQIPETVRQFSKFDQRHAPGQPLNPNLPYDAVFMPVGGDNAKTIGSLLARFDLTPDRVKRLGTGLFDDPSLTREPGLDGAWFAAPSPRARENFEQRFAQNYGYTPPRLSTLAYDSTALAAVLAQRGLSGPQGKPGFDRQSIMNPNGFTGIDGIFRFRPDGTAERGLAILEIRRGELAVIDEAPATFQQIQ